MGRSSILCRLVRLAGRGGEGRWTKRKTTTIEEGKRRLRWGWCLRGGEEKKMERRRAEEEKVEQEMSWRRRAKVESLRGRMRREEETWRRGEGTGGLDSLSA